MTVSAQADQIVQLQPLAPVLFDARLVVDGVGLGDPPLLEALLAQIVVPHQSLLPNGYPLAAFVELLRPIVPHVLVVVALLLLPLLLG